MVQLSFKQDLNKQAYQVSVPGSMMLFGEHAVLRGKQAIVAAINKRINVTLTPKQNNLLTIHSSTLGSITQDLKNIEVKAPFTYVLQAIKLMQQYIPTGFTLDIETEFASIGLGSSAAVTVATMAVLDKWLQLKLSDEQLFNLCKQVVLQIQSFGSGADIAASIYGGVLAFNLINNLPVISKLPIIPALTVIYSGYKTATAKVITIVNSAEQQDPVKYMKLFSEIHTCSAQALNVIEQQAWSELDSICKKHHLLQQQLGVSDQCLDMLVENLSMQQQIYGAKISGSGLGDCVIGFGNLTQPLLLNNNAATQFTLEIDKQGLKHANN